MTHEKEANKNDVKALCKHPEINAAVLENLKECAKIGKLTRVDTPIAVYLETEPWLPETGLVTDALKLKRKVCTRFNFDQKLTFSPGTQRPLCFCCQKFVQKIRIKYISALCKM